jgi:hypothetical protein
MTQQRFWRPETIGASELLGSSKRRQDARIKGVIMKIDGCKMQIKQAYKIINNDG